VQQQEHIIKKVELENAVVAMRDDGIVHVYFKTNAVLDVKLQMALVDVYIQLIGDGFAPFIFEAGEFVTVTKEARDNAIIMEENTPVFGSAVVVKNLAQKLIADFYYKVNRPKRPYKVVSTFEKGIQWLHEFKNSDKNGKSGKLSSLVF
jgi:hypothetical protein